MSNQTNGWLTIREAAHALGVSELTIRRRIKDRRVLHRLENGKYFVRLDGVGTDPLLQSTEEHDTSSRIKTEARTTTLSDESQPQAEVSSRGTRDDTDQVTTHDGESNHDQAEVPSLPAIDLSVLLAEHARLAEMAGRAGLLEQQLRQLEERHASLHEGTVALASRNGWLESKLEERERDIKLLTDSQRKPPWWKRLFGAPTGNG